MRAALIVWLVLLHAAAIFLFSRGFFLTRLSLSDISKPVHHGPKPTHKRAVFLIIDALRFDFVSPNPPSPPNPYYHNVLTLPAELTKSQPENSFIFNSYVDPPTTTLQRIMALTTGSLPTFLDMTNNYGAQALLEDSIINQLQLANKTIAHMGDDTWLSVFPNSFHPNLTFPYDSFNVEDLHTVDNGVLTHLIPLLKNQHPASSFTSQFDFLIGHFLGVDHVGHRVGPSHPSMHSKLTQMDNALRKIISLLDDDTLLIVLGDHGMDRAGDHGGDGILETSAALWIYSKGPPLLQSQLGSIPSGLIHYKTFPGSSSPWRSVQQIDLVPTLSLLLGLPIPYNNLGSVIPDLFWRRTTAAAATQTEYEKALQVNSEQIHQYLLTYRASTLGTDLNDAWHGLQSTWDAISIIPQLKRTVRDTVEAKLVAMTSYNHAALNACRTIWAQFNPVLMAAGLAVMLSTTFASWLVYVSLSLSPPPGGRILELVVPSVWKATGGVFFATLITYLAVGYIFPTISIGLGVLELSIFTGAMTSCVICFILTTSQPNFTFTNLKTRMITPSGVFGVLILGLHCVSFFSNSFTFWEDRFVLWLCVTSVVPIVLWGIGAPGMSTSPPTSSTTKSEKGGVAQQKRSKGFFARLGLQGRILGFIFLFLICIRLMSLVTVCREEQGGYCHVTFYPTFSPIAQTAFNDSSMMESPPPLATTTSTLPPTWALILSLPTALALPYTIIRLLRMTKSDNGIAPALVWWVVAPALIGAWGFWFIEWMETSVGSGNGSDVVENVVRIVEGVYGLRLRLVRTWIARCVVGWVYLGGVAWWVIPVCLDVRVSTTAAGLSAQQQQQQQQQGAQVVIMGFGNAFGAPYLVFYVLMFTLVYLCMLLPGQVVMGLSLIALMAYLEALDGVRDVWELDRSVMKSMTKTRTVQATSNTTILEHDQGTEPEDEEEPTTFITTIPIILLAQITFFATGHQNVPSSIQWKTGFLLSEGVQYPGSVVTIFVNSLGPFWLVGCGVGLIAGWKRMMLLSTQDGSSSRIHQDSNTSGGVERENSMGEHIIHSTLLTTLVVQIYFLVLLCGASLSAAVLRRHLMVWKVFAPRFMSGVLQLGVVDCAVVFVVWGMVYVPGVLGRVVERVGWVLAKVGV